MGSLGHLGSRQLDKFHSDHLQPNEEFLQKARRAIHSICEFLKEYCFQDAPWSGVKVRKVVKGGSLGKGTSMKNGSDADLVLFLNIFKSYTDQENYRKMIIEEIKRRLDEWQEKPYKLDVDVGLLLDLLKSYRDLEKDPEEITQKIIMWLRECTKELCLSDADLVPFCNLFYRYLKLKNDSMMITEEIKRLRNKGWPGLHFSNADLQFLLNLYKRYREMEKEQRMMIEEIRLWRIEGWGQPYLSNADLGLLLDLLKRYTEKEEEQKMIFKEMESWFNQCTENLRLQLIFKTSEWSNPRVLQFKLRSKKSVDFIEFDVLPAYDALGQYDGSRPDPQIYVDLIRTGTCGEFSPCFTELQRDFISDRPPKLKSLIRLVKHWYKELQDKSLPPKYALELLTVYAWEQGSGQDRFDTAEGFRTVLWLIEHCKEIRICWTKYYDFDNEVIKRYLQAQLRKNRPVILDPADPTANFGEKKDWDRLARKAKSYAAMNCCRKPDGSFIQPWNVPTDSPCCQKFDPDWLKVESGIRPSEANSAHCQMFDPDRFKVDSSFRPSMVNSVHCQRFDPDRFQVDSSFHPSELAKEVPREEGWCTLL